MHCKDASKKKTTRNPIQQNRVMELFFQAGDHTTHRLHKSVHLCDASEFASFVHFMDREVSQTPNRWKPGGFILRKQCVFLLPSANRRGYNFGQEQDAFVRRLEEMPPLLTKTFTAILAKHPLMDMVQCNYYKNGSVGISPHQDNESCIDQNYPIVSVTFSEKMGESRPFTLYSLSDEPLCSIQLGHGDELVMKGQDEFKHGIEKERANKYAGRLNFTFRKSK